MFTQICTTNVYIPKMTRTCPLENRSHKEFSIEYLQNQINPGDTLL